MVEEDQIDFDPEALAAGQECGLTRIAGVDISFSKLDNSKVVAAVIVFEFPSMKVIYEDYEKDETDYPYVPGFLAFKELPSYVKLFDRLQANAPEMMPQVCLVDGNGILHTRNFGCASHVGVTFKVPTIGVGKTIFYIDGLGKEAIRKACDEKLQKGGDHLDLVGVSGKTWGAALRATNESKNPIIVSVGHRVSLATSLIVVKACCKKFKIPEPVRQADLRSR